MTRTIALLAGCILSVVSLGAQAQSPGVQLTMDPGFYIGGGFGSARTGEGCLGTCDTRDTTYQLFAGYQFNRHLAIEAGYSDFGDTTLGATLVGVPVTNVVKATAVELVGVGLLPLTDAFSLYVKLGVFRYEADGSATGAFVGTSTGKGTEFTVGAGMQYAFTRNFAARFEWQHYNDIGTGIPGFEKDDISVWRLAARYKF